MKVKELIAELQKYNPDGIVELSDVDGSMGSEDTGWMPEDGPCESVTETRAGVLLSNF